MISFIATILGCNKKETVGTDFAIIDAMMDEKPLVGHVNFSYNNFNSKSKYPWCLQLSVPLEPEEVNENGMANTLETTQSCYQLKDKLIAEIEKLTTIQYVAHYFNDGFFDAYVYIDTPKKVHEYLQTQLEHPDRIRGFAYQINRDENWSRIDFLLHIEK